MDPYLVRWLPVIAVQGVLVTFAFALRWKIRAAERRTSIEASKKC